MLFNINAVDQSIAFINSEPKIKSLPQKKTLKLLYEQKTNR